MRKLLAIFVALSAVAGVAGATRFDSAPSLVRVAGGTNTGNETGSASGNASGNASGSASGSEVAPKQAPTDDGSLLLSIARETWIHATPDLQSPRIGYLRAGAKVPRSREAVSHQSCADGFYAVAPRGYVCIGNEATLDLNHPVAQLASRPPRREGLPHTYVTSRYPPPPLYGKLPGGRMQREREPALEEHLKKRARLERGGKGYVAPPPADPIPELIASGSLLPSLDGAPRAVARGWARRRSGFALLATYDHEGRRFGLTAELALAPLDRARVVAPSELFGAVFDDKLRLPVAIVKSKKAQIYRTSSEANPPRAAEDLARYTVLGLSGEKREHRGRVFLRTANGDFVRKDQVVRINGFREPPDWAKRGEKWIDVSILQQTLVAYRGTEPVFATMVSTGADGLAKHEGTRATIQGTFLIHTKHVTTTMKSDDLDQEFELQDVPYVQYFTEGYALHGVYWHDDFGKPRSHGCVNLAPKAAAWLFSWTDPQVPEHWHAALADKGTTVHVHP